MDKTAEQRKRRQRARDRARLGDEEYKRIEAEKMRKCRSSKRPPKPAQPPECFDFSLNSTSAESRKQIDGFRQRQLAFPARFWWSRFACLRSNANTSLLVDSGPAFHSVLQVAMPTVNWEECPQSVYNFHCSLERILC